MTYQSILSETRDRIATITLNRPERLNALNDAMVEEVWQAVQAAAADGEVRVIVLTGAGRAFCSGADVGNFAGNDPNYLVVKQQRPFDMNRRPDYQTRHSLFPAVPKPVIGMLNGSVAGLGLLYALFCDIRFAAAEAMFTTAFARIGLSAEYGMAWVLRETVGHSNALDLLMSGRKIDAGEALRMGLVNQVHPREALAAATYAYARDMAELCSPRSLRAMKEQVWEAPFQTLAEAVVAANRDMLISNASEDFREGTKAFQEKRRPNWSGKLYP
jgi:enoyl-CoA hydratase/carnithine racemase